LLRQRGQWPDDVRDRDRRSDPTTRLDEEELEVEDSPLGDAGLAVDQIQRPQSLG
jgi:hypothetical protein